MSDNDHTRQRIITSVFDKRNAGTAVQESYVAHIKIWEDAGDGQGKKPRYILLSRASDRAGFIHKSKLNTNGSFSVGKSWKLAELRGIEVLSSTLFNITLARTYKWQTESPDDQLAFVRSIVDLFQSLIGGHLHIAGVPGLTGASGHTPYRQEVDVQPQPRPISVTLSPGKRTPLSAAHHIPQVNNDRVRGPLSQSPVRPHLMDPPSRSVSPSGSVRGLAAHISSPRGNVHHRPATPPPQQQPPPPPRPPAPLRPRNIPQPLNALPSTAVPAANSPLPSTPTPARQQLNVPPSRHLQEYGTGSNGQSFIPSPLSAHPATAALQPPSYASSLLQTQPHSSKTNAETPKVSTVRRDNNRISFFDPANQAVISRLVAGDLGDDGDDDGAEENAQATMLNVEEMLEGYDWASDDLFSRRSTRGAADLVEARLLDELTALEKANIHSFLESDDRVNLVVKYLEEALSEVDAIDSLLSSYKIHLNAVGDDISFIQSQRRGLQVQTQNQRALLHELENLLQTVQVDRGTLIVLSQESLEKPASIQRLEEAATELYKALQAGQDTEMAATMERLDEYRTHNSQFCKRIFDYLSIMIVAQAKIISQGNNGVNRTSIRARPNVVDHQSMETYLCRYTGLMLYLREMDEPAYSKLCAAYFLAASELHSKQIKTFLSIYTGLLRKPSDEDNEQGFAATTSNKTGAIRRAGTIVRSPVDPQKRERDKRREEEYYPSDALGYIIEEVAPLIYREADFIARFLQINDTHSTFADHAGLDNYFRRHAARSAGLSQSTVKLVRGAMDLIFGFLPQELKQWIDSAIGKDTLQVVGIIVCLERFLAEADERSNSFFLQMLDKQHLRLKATFDRHVNEQIKMVDETKLTSKKRKGVAHFIKHFPTYVVRVEQQLAGADDLEIRASVDLAYEKIVHSMFECLKHMATLDGDGEDKGQLNYHVLLVENMHCFVAEMSQLKVPSVTESLKQAESIYNENLSAYVKIVLRRPFSKIIDSFDGVERLLKTTAPSEVQKNSNYNKSALRRVLKEFDSKDVRKHIDVLFRRVEKHFTEAEENTTRGESSGIVPGMVMVGVWKACEEELLRMTESFSARIAQCYSDSGLALEYSASDVEAAFKRHQSGS